MKNINKNAVHAIELSKGSYLAHKSIGDFTMGKMEFTIEISFICNDVSDCLLYAQEQGFQFGIRNGLLYFEQEGVGRITQKEEVVIEPNILYFAAASCKENVLSLYLEGLPIADKIDVKTEAAANDGNYVIGKGLNGYIAELRLRSCGMEDREILKDNGNGLEECESVEFWGDFSTVQYKDKSPNALPLWTNEGMVTCVNVACCTKISANGGFITMAKNSYTSGYTLLFKMFPQIEANNKMYVYSLTTEEDTAFAIGLDSDDNGDKYIFVEHNGEVFSNKSILPIGSWVDVGLCIEEAEARLYVDGIKQLTFAFNGGLNQTRAFIGIEPFQNKVNYDNSFFGYLDYFAEFECVLDEDNIIFYSEEQPYVFDNSIRTLYSFYCGEPIDLKSGNTVLKVGESRALFEKGLNPLSAPIGMDLRVSTKVCDEWGKLSEEEQWATTAMNIVREVYAGSVGLIPAAGNLPIEQVATTQIRLSYESVINEVKKVWKVADGKHEIADLIGASLRKGIGGLAAAVSGAAKTAKKMFSEKAMEILAGILIVGGTALAIGGAAYLIYKACNQDRPENKKGDLKLISICCNHQGEPHLGSIHFHSDADLTLPDTMTYKNPSVDDLSDEMSMDMLIIPRMLTDRKVRAIIRVKNMSKEEYRGRLKVNSNGLFEETATEEDIVLAPSEEMDVDLSLRLRIDEDNSGKYVDEIFQFYYTKSGQDFFMQKCNVAVYMQSKLPIEPWKTEVGTDYDQANKEYPSLVFIKNIIFSSKNRVTDIDDIMNTLFDSNKLRYNYNEKFTSDYNMFKLIKFNNVIKDNNSVEVNCVDCANIVSLIAAEIGKKMKLKMICGYNDFDKGFDLNPIIPMGYGET